MLVVQHSGYVLAGGKSSRMGRDKALLPFRGTTLVQHVAQVVARAVGNVTLVGPAERYAHLGLRVIEDQWPGFGPLAGIHRALLDCPADWAVIVACDLPYLSPDLLSWMLKFTATEVETDVFLATLDGVRPEPLCGVYRKTIVTTAGAALLAGRRKVVDMLSGLRIQMVPVSDARLLTNINTPSEWREVVLRSDD
ncbi:MAG: molybdenum cofactor guanylyltransferase [Bryobacteraceae bacterium]|nr:molybdenum cofactor guanylyltransferase [Bryobacteraceae bacterium]MDW8376812.1 molybdenum cofactor guanylyltransferase [Bryobacterales bacterium]